MSRGNGECKYQSFEDEEKNHYKDKKDSVVEDIRSGFEFFDEDSTSFGFSGKNASISEALPILVRM